MVEFEIRIPVLPQPGFYSNVKLAAYSLARLGGIYARAPISVSVGGSVTLAEIEAANPWARAFPNVSWHPVPADQADDPFSSGFNRFALPPSRDVVILSDADICFLRDIDDLLARMGDSPNPVVAGMQAHFPPHPHRSDPAKNAQFWHDVFRSCGLEPPPLDYPYSELDPAQSGGAPPYFNLGFVAMNRRAFREVGPVMVRYTRELASRDLSSPYRVFSAQIALSLAIRATGAEVVILGPEFNCPNSDEMLAHGLRSPEDIRLLHYLREDVFNRHHFLSDPDSFDAFARTQFSSPVIEHFRRHVLTLPEVHPARS